MYCVTPSIFVNGPSCKILLMMLFFLAYLYHLQLFIILLSLFQTLGINIVVTVLQWGSYNFYNCFEMLQWPKGEVGYSFGEKKDTPKCSLLWVKVLLCQDGFQERLALSGVGPPKTEDSPAVWGLAAASWLLD